MGEIPNPYASPTVDPEDARVAEERIRRMQAALNALLESIWAGAAAAGTAYAVWVAR